MTPQRILAPAIDMFGGGEEGRDRRWQIDALLADFPACEVIAPGELFSVSLLGPHGCPVSILIDLPPTFPTTEPLLLCEPPVEHPSVSPTGQLLAGRWDASCSLARMIADTEAAFAMTNEKDTVVSGSEWRGRETTWGSSQRPSPASLLNDAEEAILRQLSPDQVAELLKSDDKMAKFVANLPVVVEQTTMLADLQQEAYNLAKTNLQTREDIGRLADRLRRAHDDYSATLQSCQNFFALHAETLNSLHPEALTARIQASLLDMDDTTTEFVTEALKTAIRDDGSLDASLHDYIKMRTDFHRHSLLLRKHQTS